MDNNKKTITKTDTPHIKKIVLVASGKGGVGKSTVAAGIALSLAKEGKAVGLLDADIHGPSVPALFNIDNKYPQTVEKNEKTHIIPYERNQIKIMSLGFFVKDKQAVVWRGPMVSNVLQQLCNDTDWGELDYLIVDTPPGTGDVHITLLQQYNISGVVLVTTPQPMAIADVHKAAGLFNSEKIGAPVIGVVENMAWFTPAIHPDEKYYIFGKGGGDIIAEEWNVPILQHIPIHEHMREYCDNGEVYKILNDSILQTFFIELAHKINNVV
ncbi:MAG: Mrp/NBP35 family ATP-binding protein [Bacteroidales bacterium]